MAQDEKSKKDDFWDIEKLVPSRRGRLNPFITSSPVVDVEIPTKSANASEEPSPTVSASQTEAAERRITAFTTEDGRRAEEETYFPTSAGMIKRVTVKKYVDRYDFYDNFRKAALIYYDYKTPKCDFVQFYSYMPQYSQLNPEQKNYYFYWRSELQRGKYIKTDYSYVYLYVYEILNLPDKIPPEEGLKRLVALWRAYRKDLPRLDLHFSVWVQDYCLVHRLSCPTDQLGDFIFDVIAASQLKEFYLSDVNRAGADGAMAVLAYLSDYDWRRGKYASGNPELPEGDTRRRFATAEAYRDNLRGAAYALISVIWDRCASPDEDAPTKIVARNAFPSSLCTHMVKRMLEIEYYSISDSAALRAGITAAVRYIENKLRALMGVKSRLAVKGLPDEYRAIIDCYFEGLFAADRREQERRAIPEYEKLYDAPTGELSLEGADEIERVSWGTTLRLVENEDGDEPQAILHGDFSGAPEPDTAPTCDETEQSSGPCDTVAVPTPEESDSAYGLSDGHIALLRELVRGGAVNASPEYDTLAEEINVAFSDNFGDVIIENNGECYLIIEDYLEDVIEWLKIQR